LDIDNIPMNLEVDNPVLNLDIIEEKPFINTTAVVASGTTGSDASAVWDDAVVDWDDVAVDWDGGAVYESSDEKPIFNLKG